MWIAFAAGWILGSVSLYAYMVITAKEPKNNECMDCHVTDCSQCAYMHDTQAPLLRRAA